MLKSLKWKVIKWLRVQLSRLCKEYNVAEHQDRLASVRAFFHTTLPAIQEKETGWSIIEDGKFNYFELPSGDLPHYDFVLPEIPLYVVVPGIVSASWSEARERGITRDQWEAAQADLAALQHLTPTLATIGLAAEPRLLLIKWDDPVNHLVLADRLQELMK